MLFFIGQLRRHGNIWFQSVDFRIENDLALIVPIRCKEHSLRSCPGEIHAKFQVNWFATVWNWRYKIYFVNYSTNYGLWFYKFGPNQINLRRQGTFPPTYLNWMVGMVYVFNILFQVCYMASILDIQTTPQSIEVFLCCLRHGGSCVSKSNEILVNAWFRVRPEFSGMLIVLNSCFKFHAMLLSSFYNSIFFLLFFLVTDIIQDQWSRTCFWRK